MEIRHPCGLRISKGYLWPLVFKYFLLVLLFIFTVHVSVYYSEIPFGVTFISRIWSGYILQHFNFALLWNFKISFTFFCDILCKIFFQCLYQMFA